MATLIVKDNTGRTLMEAQDVGVEHLDDALLAVPLLERLACAIRDAEDLPRDPSVPSRRLHAVT